MSDIYDISSLYSLDDAYSKPIYFEVFISIIVWTLWLLSGVGNVLVVIIFMRDRTLRNKVANRYILNLALADLLVGFNSLTIKNIWRYYGNWPFGKFICKMYVIVDYTVVCQSFFAITLISFDRFLLVTKELSYSKYQTKRMAWTLILSSWTLSFGLFGLPVLLYEPLTEKPVLKPYNITCYQHVSYLRDYNIAILVLTFIIPSAVLVFLNLAVFTNIYRRSKGLVRTRSLNLTESTSNSVDEQQWASPRNRGDIGPALETNLTQDSSAGGAGVSPGNSVRVANLSTRTKMASYRRHYKAAVTLSILVGVFLVCATPLYVFKCLLSFSGIDHDWIWWNIVDYMTWANSSINPFLYAVTNPKMRAGYKSILCFWKKSRPTRTLAL
ncbi:histamine H3 receptor-like [Acanthaster planci]|uniref:Histamine H3 receptor-like n=1 Tax=Acanthaster planci TaxID=133434 RepID=A0A8B7Z0M4_ACAPL|nr:histamine H3 receptor-like [Acanthaster planci]